MRVLRYDRGDEILLTDGRGTTYHARITNPHPRHCEFEVLSQEKQEKTHNIYLHVAIAPTKNIERQGLNIPIEVDGGVSPANAKALTEAGAEILVAGSAVFLAEDPATVISAMKN